jgi:hypothetical protein
MRIVGVLGQNVRQNFRDRSGTLTVLVIQPIAEGGDELRRIPRPMPTISATRSSPPISLLEHDLQRGSNAHDTHSFASAIAARHSSFAS